MFQTRIKTHHSAMAGMKEYLLGDRGVVDILRENPKDNKENATIYIHVPFCSKICSFCNMRRSLQKPHEEYANMIVEEIEKYARLPYVNQIIFDAVYFGGGTPTTLSTRDLRKILRALKDNFKFTRNAEFTIETTVTELTDDKIDMFYEEGVNRFSVGIQTFHNEGRELMGRIGSGEAAYGKLKALKEKGFKTVSMDLIYNYPNQTMDMLKEDLDKIISLDLNGFSMYSLINMKETKMGEAQDQNNDEKMFFFIAEYMEKAGYRFLELTKMVKDDSYKYIMNRHKGADTLPLGAGAGGSVNGLTLMNPIKLAEYEQSITDFNQRRGMYFKEAYNEVVKFKGDIQTISLPKNESLYKDADAYHKLLEKLLKEKMIEKTEDGFKLTLKGIFWGNSLSRELSSMIAS